MPICQILGDQLSEFGQGGARYHGAGLRDEKAIERMLTETGEDGDAISNVLALPDPGARFTPGSCVGRSDGY